MAYHRCSPVDFFNHGLEFCFLQDCFHFCLSIAGKNFPTIYRAKTDN